jgi:hypothetical protein
MGAPFLSPVRNFAAIASQLRRSIILAWKGCSNGQMGCLTRGPGFNLGSSLWHKLLYFLQDLCSVFESSKEKVGPMRTCTPTDWRIPFSFNGVSSGCPNSLLVNEETGDVYLVEKRNVRLTHGWEQVIVLPDGTLISQWEDLRPFRLNKVTLRQALEWYARTAEFSRGATGDITILCRMALEALPN